jgi:hypothetical protein
LRILLYLDVPAYHLSNAILTFTSRRSENLFEFRESKFIGTRQQDTPFNSGVGHVMTWNLETTGNLREEFAPRRVDQIELESPNSHFPLDIVFKPAITSLVI